jgi:hypothetical protein
MIWEKENSRRPSYFIRIIKKSILILFYKLEKKNLLLYKNYDSIESQK